MDKQYQACPFIFDGQAIENGLRKEKSGFAVCLDWIILGCPEQY